MKRLTVIFVAFVTLILLGGVFLLTKNSKNHQDQTLGTNTKVELPKKLEYFWGEGCPHCKIVEEFLSSWDKTDKVSIEKFEVWNNIDNAKKLQAVGTYCKIPQNELGVPLLFTPKGECFVGDEPIINYLKTLEL